MSPLSSALITRRLLKELPTRFRCRVWRQNVIVAQRNNQVIRSGIPGMADISGVIHPGIRLEIEVKAGDDRQSQAQLNYQAMIEKHGGIYLIARDPDETFEHLRARLNKRGITTAEVPL